jgi:glycosyltransferase involved in cell wall biosynthesis
MTRSIPPHARVPVCAVLPCWQNSGTLERALQSIAAQTTLPARTVLVDDGNLPDESQALGEIASRFPELSPEIVRLTNNLGPGSARNAGWATAQERYIAFLDADDVWHPRKLELQTALMEAHPEVELSGHRVMVLQEGAQLPESPIGTGRVHAPGRAALLVVNPFATPTWMIRREARVRFCEGKRHVEDHLLLMELALRGGQLLALDLSLAALFKPSLSRTGLSSQLWKMELGELDAYRRLRALGLLGRTAAALLSALSLVKFARRVAIVKLLR